MVNSPPDRMWYLCDDRGTTVLLFERLLSELDDVMHNSLGCILGYVMSVTFVYGKIKIQNHCT